ncbi:MAG: RNA methyltransferase [bacterium]|nr:RNA methyltransferase [bacterium]
MRIAQVERQLTAARVARMRHVLEQRLPWLTIVLDNVFDPHNLSAVLRSCDAFGVQEVHVIESVEQFRLNRLVSQGAEYWLTIHRWAEFGPCRAYLRRRGFRLYATTLSSRARAIDAVSTERPLAFVFGNEHRGVMPEIIAGCDGEVMIPMYGFVQSLNVSVAAAITLATVGARLRAERPEVVGLKGGAWRRVYRSWLERHVKRAAGQTGEEKCHASNT